MLFMRPCLFALAVLKAHTVCGRRQPVVSVFAALLVVLACAGGVPLPFFADVLTVDSIGAIGDSESEHGVRRVACHSR